MRPIRGLCSDPVGRVTLMSRPLRHPRRPRAPHRSRRPRSRSLHTSLLALALAAVLAGCGKSSPELSGDGSARKLAPVTPQGAVSVATRNTTRLGGADAATDAAGVARAVYPGLTATTRPQAVILVDERDWSAALAASVLASAPLGAPILYTDGKEMPEVTAQTLKALRPLGVKAFGGAQVITLGATADVGPGYVVRALGAADPAVTAAAVEELLESAEDSAPRQVIVVSANAPEAAVMSAAGLAAESSAPILFVTPGRVPDPTQTVLVALHRPSIYVVDPANVGRLTLHELRHFGAVTEIAPPSAEGSGAVANSLAVARFTDGSFGWGVKEPGHGLVFANEQRPLDGPAAALLSATGDYGPLLALEAPATIPAALARYLGDIKPAYSATVRPVKAVYNHGWLIGDEAAISAVTQAELDSLLEISPEAAEEQSSSQAE